jgi:hypothetical protein
LAFIKICGKDVGVEGRLVRIARIDGDRYVSLEHPEAVLDGLQKSGCRIDLFTFMQLLPDTTPKHNFPMEWDNVAALPVSTFEHWWTRQIDGKTRNMVRRAEKKGVVVREVSFDDALIRGIWEVYNECPVRQGKRFPHYGKDVETVGRISATFLGTSIFIGALLDDKLIGFVKLTTDEARSQAGVMHIVSMVKHRDKSPTNALIAEAVRSCARRGIPYLVYSNFAYGKKQRDSLSDFKESNGFRRIDLPRYYVPLTPVGHLALLLGLHHSIVDHVPESVLARFRKFRSDWYNRGVQSATVAS